MSREERDPRYWLDRSVELAAELESARERIADLESRLTAAISVDVDAAARRVVGAEDLLVALKAHIEANPSLADVMPPGYVERLEAQLRMADELSQRKYAVPPYRPGKKARIVSQPLNKLAPGGAYQIGGPITASGTLDMEPDNHDEISRMLGTFRGQIG